MKRDSYSNQQSHASFQPRSPQAAIEPTQLGQPVHHSSSTSDIGAKWLNKASRWVADKFQTAQNFMGSGDAISPDQLLPALKGTAKPALSQTNSTPQPLVGVIDSGFDTDEHGSKMVEAIQQENPQAKIWQREGVGTGGGLESLVEFVDVAKATGQTRSVANLSFDLTEVHPDGSISTRTQLTAEEQSALAYARDNGVLVVASAGNQGGAMSALGQASKQSDNLIVVGAANGSDRASYSSYGNGLDLVTDVGAAGTSLAAAKVTGAIANIWSANPELSSQQVEQILTTTATDLKTPGRDTETGAGLLNLTGAIDLATHTTPGAIVFSGAQLIQQVPGSLDSATWESQNGSVASENTNRLLEGDGPRSPAPPTSGKRVVKPHGQGKRKSLNPQPTASQRANELHRQMERTPLPPRPAQPTPTQQAARTTPAPNPLGLAAMEQSHPNLGQVAIQQGDTLWDVAQAQLGSGDRWRELRKADGSPFTEQEASRLQVGTSIQIPGAQPDPIPTPPPDPAFALHRQMERAPLPPPPPPLPPAPEPNHVADFFSSVGNKLWEAGEGAFETVTNPGQAVDDLVSSVHTIANDPGQALNSFAKPYVDAFNSGRYGDLGGQLAGDALLAVTPGGLPARINNVLGRLPDAPPATIPSSPIPALPEPTSVRTPSPIPALPEPTSVRAPSPNPTPTTLTPSLAPNSPTLPPPDPAPDSIASIPDDFGNALREMGDGETLDSPPSNVPPAPQSGSLGNGDNISPQNPLTDSRGSPSSSDLELAAPNISRPSADNHDRQLVTVGARDLEQTPSSTDRSTADSRNYEPVAVGGGNGGTRPSNPSTASATLGATTRDRNSRADSAPAPRSGGSGNSNQPPRKPPNGGSGSPSSSDSEPDDLNKPSSTNGTSNTPPQGPYRNSQGQFARDPNASGTAQTKDREREFTNMFRGEQARIIADDESHPLRFLLDGKGKLVQDVQAGHTMMLESGRREMLAIEDKSLNASSYHELQALRQGNPIRKQAIEIRGATVELETARKWENEGKLPKGTVANAVSRPGWTKDLRINDRGVEVAEATGRFSEAQIQRLKEIATGKKATGEEAEPLNRLSSKDRKLYRDYYQALMDSRPKVTNGRPGR